MIKVRILTPEHGHQTVSLSVQQTQAKVAELGGESRVAVFQDGLPVTELKDEIDATIVPRFAGG